MDWRTDVGQKLIALDGVITENFSADGLLYPSKAIRIAMDEAKAAWCADDYHRAAHLALVVTAMVRREAPIFRANPAGWIAKLKMLGIGHATSH